MFMENQEIVIEKSWGGNCKVCGNSDCKTFGLMEDHELTSNVD